MKTMELKEKGEIRSYDGLRKRLGLRELPFCKRSVITNYMQLESLLAECNITTSLHNSAQYLQEMEDETELKWNTPFFGMGVSLTIEKVDGQSGNETRYRITYSNKDL